MPATDSSKTVALLARQGAARERLRQAVDAAGGNVVLEADPVELDLATLAGIGAQAVLVALEPAVEDALVALEPVLESPDLLVIFDEADLAARRDGWEAQRWIRHLAAKLHGHDDVLPPGREHDIDFSAQLQPGRPAALHQAHAGIDADLALGGETVDLAAQLPPDLPPPLPAVEAPPAPAPWEDGSAALAWDEPAPWERAAPALEPEAPAAAPAVPPPLPEPSAWTLADDAPATPGPAPAAAPPPLPDFSNLSLVELEPVDTGAPVAKGAVLVLAGIGGPDAVRKLLGALPAGFPQPVLVQLRLDGGRYDNLVKQMARVSPVPVALAMPGDAVAPGSAYVLPDGVGVEPAGNGLRFIDAGPGHEPVEALPPTESAVLVLSGAEPARMDAVLALAARGAYVAGQALDGCYDPTAARMLEAGGAPLAAPAMLANQLVARLG
ncbi:chemotaxis protein CheB [Pseudoxanthomonas sp. SGT-18]|uniref:chemotaxis protein CheB n=1 Tax=Pseudoxanthomonas sp. SGT-18 TaxID=2493087 RepID=UPI000F6297AC|nr:chemotaxis protein CheB [Pseudoxanthomonas sp. SGT-18]